MCTCPCPQILQTLCLPNQGEKQPEFWGTKFLPSCQIQPEPDAGEQWRHNYGSNQCSTRNEQQHRPPIPPSFWQVSTDVGWHYCLPAGHAQQVGQEHHSLQEFSLLNIVSMTALLLIRPKLWNWCYKALPVTAEVVFSILRCFRLSKTTHFWYNAFRY